MIDCLICVAVEHLYLLCDK